MPSFLSSLPVLSDIYHYISGGALKTRERGCFSKDEKGVSRSRRGCFCGKGIQKLTVNSRVAVRFKLRAAYSHREFFFHQQ